MEHSKPVAPVESLAEWVSAIRAHDLSAAAITQAKLLLLDTIGCGFAALDEESARAVLPRSRKSGGAPQCTVIGRARKTSAPNATLVNGALVRILDFNDYVNTKAGELGGHPSDNIPVALAAGELTAPSGREIIAAIVHRLRDFRPLQGTDGPQQRLGRRHRFGLRGAGDGGPPDAGSTGTAATRLRSAARARRPRPRCASAIFPPPSRRQRAGRAERHAGGAARRARHHRPARPVREPARHRVVFSQGDAAAALTAPLAAESYHHGGHVKAFPCLATGQSVAAAGIELHGSSSGDDRPPQAFKLTIADTPGLRRQKDDPGRIEPNSREAADHSFNFLAAVSLIDGEFGLAQFDNNRWDDPQGVRADGAARDRPRCRWNTAHRTASRARSRCDRQRDASTGWRSPTRPASPAAGFCRTVVRKFHGLTAAHLSRAARSALSRRCHGA